MHFKCGVLFNIKLEGVLIIFKLKHGIVPLSLAILATVYGASEAKAAEVTVKSQAEIDAALASITEDTTIKLDPTYSSGNVKMDINTTHNVTIDGNNVNLVDESIFTDHSSGEITLKNILIDGELATSIKNMTINVENKDGKVTLEHSVFTNNYKSGDSPVIITGDEGTVDVKEVLFSGNSPQLAGGIFVNESGIDLNVYNSTFEKNYSDVGVSAGIYSFNSNGKMKVNNTIFRKNSFSYGDHMLNEGAGSIFIESPKAGGSLEVKDSIFDENKVYSFGGPFEPSAGGISVNNFKSTNKLSVTGTTFKRNLGISGGGAILVKKMDDSSNNINLENNTFFSNETREVNGDGYFGGAVAVMNQFGQTPTEQNTQVFTSKNNTYLDNRANKKNGFDEMDSTREKLEVKGGAVGIHEVGGKFTFKNDLMVGNRLLNNETATKNYNNIFSSVKYLETIKSLGIDNGIESKDTLQQAYGKYPVELAANGSKIKAGRTVEAEVVPTLMIAPKLINTAGNTYTGFANMETSEGPETDQRGYKRAGKHDIGAVEISSFVYDANGGKFTLPELPKYDGKTYYEGKDPIQYAKVDGPNSKYTVLNGQSVLKPVRPNHKFLGWADVRNATKPDPKFNTGTTHTVVDQKTIYAVWESSKYTLKYHSNSKTSGVVPYQKAVDSSKEITIKPQGSMKRKSYKFKGWSTKPSAITADPKYAPGKKMKLTKKVSLYAVWRR